MSDPYDVPDPVIDLLKRRQHEARSLGTEHHKLKLCVICGMQDYIELAHLDQQPGNNEPDNLAWLCPTHHKMFDGGLYPIEGVKLLRAHWAQTEGRMSHKARMKDAGAKAATTRKWRRAGLKAAETRRANVAARASTTDAI